MVLGLRFWKRWECESDAIYVSYSISEDHGTLFPSILALVRIDSASEVMTVLSWAAGRM